MVLRTYDRGGKRVGKERLSQNWNSLNLDFPFVKGLRDLVARVILAKGALTREIQDVRTIGKSSDSERGGTFAPWP